MTRERKNGWAMRCVVASLVFAAGCSSRTTETLEIKRGVFMWVNRDQEPQRTWTYRGKMTVRLTPDYAYVTDGNTRLVVPREKVLYVAEGTDPGEWK